MFCARAVYGDFKRVGGKVWDREQGCDLLIGSRKMHDAAAITADCVVVRFGLMFVYGFATERQTFDGPIRNKPLEVAVNSSRVEVREGGLDGGRRKRPVFIDQDGSDSFAFGAVPAFCHTFRIPAS